MTRIGITGAIGSGKSFVGRVLEARGFRVMDADRAVHGLYVDNAGLRKKIGEAFGEDLLIEEPLENGLHFSKIDTRRLADIVFSDEGERRKLESIVYPYLTEKVRDFLCMSEFGPPLGGVVFLNMSEFRTPHGDVFSEKIFVEAALLTRVPEIVSMLDEIWIVTAPEDVREKRLVHRGLSLDDARRRIADQRGECTPSRFEGKKVVIIENAGEKSDVERKLDELLNV